VKKVGLLVGVLLLAPAAAEGAERYDFGPAPIVRDAETACPPTVGSCVLLANPGVIHTPAASGVDRYMIRHERGHVLDFTLTRVHRYRRAWLAANNIPPGTPWGSFDWTAPDAPFEQSAESYAACSLNLPPRYADYDHGWNPTPAEYQTTCRVLTREAAALASQRGL
jgi:hypothetical protein